jgi:hypothetical protein
MKTRTVCVLVLFGLINGCTPIPSKTPLGQPSLVSVDLRGSRICGPFQTALDGSLAFTCEPLPTLTATGWELKPDSYTNAEGKVLANKTAIIKMTTASLSDLTATFNPSATSSLPLRKVPPRQYKVPPTIDSNRAIEVEATDDGTIKTWTVRARANQCQEVVPLAFTATAPGQVPSAPLFVTLARAPSADRCSISSGGGGFGTSGTSSPPSGGAPSSSCPGGAQKTQVILCLQCPKNAPQGLWDAESDEVCSAAAYLAQRKAEKPACDVWEVPTVEACYFP